MTDNTLFATFYSYKGGVGRTLTLVNTACELASLGHSVIVWEMDIEAPGIQNIPYLKGLKGEVKGGVVDVIHDYRKNDCRRLDSKKFKDYVVAHPDNSNLRFLLAGNLEDDRGYSRKYASLELDRLFGENEARGYKLFELIRKELQIDHPDFVLIDSRTGFTDIGGICCFQLPHVTFLVFTYGNQNLRGIRKVYNALADDDRKKKLGKEHLKVYLIASMVPEDYPDRRKEKREEWKSFNLRPHVEIPYNPVMIFDETVWRPAYPDDPFCEHYGEIARILIDERNNLPKETPTTEIGAFSRGRRESKKDAKAASNKAKEFEKNTADLFRLMGYDAEQDKLIRGNQVDVFLTRKTQIETSHYIVECKDLAHNVGKDIVDEVENNLKAARTLYPGCRAIIVSRSGFTNKAKAYAESINMTLKTYDELLSGIVDFNRYLAFIKTLFAGTELEKNYIEQDVIMEDIEGTSPTPLLDHINHWQGKEEGGFLTLLGDFGTGKTSFTRKLAYEMARMYEKDKTGRVPVLINLKDVQKALSLENILYNHFSKTVGINIPPEIILHLLKEGKILLILDGFDEMATQTNAALTMQNFQELNNAFAGKAKIILTCRTHYFKDRAETEETLKSEEKDLSELSTELYRAIKGKQGYAIGYLQEFTGSQIEKYLKKTLPDTWKEAQETIHSVYDLKSLSSRPVLLDMIVKSLPSIMEKGGAISAADIYAAYVKIWTERDDWRHQLTRQGRELLVEEIAERLWQQDADRLHYNFLGDVLKDYLKDKKTAVTAIDIELASSEIRTASFLVRDDEGNYGFAHRSFLEYFLARRIAKKLMEGDTSCLDLRRLSKEVVFFLSRIYDRDLLMETLREILAMPYMKRVSENALIIFYWSSRYQHSRDGKIEDAMALRALFAHRRPFRFNLKGADLERAELAWADFSEAELEGASLTAASLTGASLKNASLKHADLSFATFNEADLSDANLSHAEASHASFKNANMKGSDLSSGTFHGCSFLGADIKNAVFSGADLSMSGFFHASIDEKALEQANTFGAGSSTTEPGNLDPAVSMGHASSVSSVAVSPDGKLLASGSRDRSVKLWDIDTGRELRTLTGHLAPVLSVAFIPDGEILASGDTDNIIILWQVETGRELRTLTGHLAPVLSVVFSHDGKFLASGSYDHSIRIWEVKTGREMKTLTGHSAYVHSVAISPDGKLLASGSSDESIRLWDIETGREVKILIGHSDDVRSVVFSLNGKFLASGSDDHTVRLWDIKAGTMLKILSGHSARIDAVAFSPDGKLLASGSEDRSIMLWDVEGGRALKALKGGRQPVTSVFFSPDGKLLASGSYDQSIRLWDIETRRETKAMNGRKMGVTSVVFNQNGRFLASGCLDSSIRIWDLETGKGMKALISDIFSVTSVDLSPDGKLLAAGGLHGSVRLWYIETERVLKDLTGHKESVKSVAFSPDGKLLAAGGWDGSVRLWDIKTGRELKALTGQSGPVSSVAFSPDGKLLASGSYYHSIILWDIKTGREIKQLVRHSGEVFSVAFSPDGKLLASGGEDDSIWLWDIEKGRELKALTGHLGPVSSVVFSPDGELLATGSYDHSIRLWDVNEGKEIIQAANCSTPVLSVAFRCRAPELAAGTGQGSINLYNVQKNGGKATALKQAATLFHLPDGQWASIDPDNKYACSEGGRNYIYFSDRLAVYPASDLPELERPGGILSAKS